jgi:hypothetical protein
MQVARLILGQDLRLATEEVYNSHNQVIEVQGIALGKKLLVTFIYPRHYFLEVAANKPAVILGSEEPGLGRGDC